jgi:hypothetical protein
VVAVQVAERQQLDRCNTRSVSSWHRVLTCLTVLCAVALLVPASAAAGTSAGDQQYIDPLAGSGLPANSGQSSHGGGPATASPAPTTTTAAPTTTTAVPTATTASSTPPSSATTHADPPVKTLPMTGLDLWLAAVVGMALIAAGLVLRRSASGT